MEPKKEAEYCDVCDHRIVRGVACDGHPNECTYHSEGLKGAAVRHADYSAAVARCLGNEDCDAVRGID